MTPLLTTWLAGTLVPVDPKALFLSTLQVCERVIRRTPVDEWSEAGRSHPHMF
jgi:hypothetical protein